MRRAGASPNGVELASEKVEELVKSFEHVNEILDGFRYKQEPILLIQRHSGLGQLCQGRIMAAAVFFFTATILWFFLLGWIMHIWATVDAARYRSIPFSEPISR